MISHMTLGTSDLDRAERFYSEILGPLGWQLVHSDPDYRGWATGFGADGRPNKPMFWVALPFDGQPMSVGNGVHVAFMVDAAQEVIEAYERGLGAGGRDLGSPGFHPEYHERYFGAFLADPDDNKVQICCHAAEPDDVGAAYASNGSGGCG